MCAVQHEPPRVPLTARPNPHLAPGMDPTFARFPGMCPEQPCFWGAAGHPQRISSHGA